MNLANFQDNISNTILKRGKNYYNNGHITELVQLPNGNWLAEVEGTHDYTVKVRLASNNGILTSSCSCPYDGPYCKHEVAVFYALQKRTAKELNNASPLKTILMKQTKESLIDFLLKLASTDPHFQQKIIKTFINNTATATHQQTLEIAEKTILKPMRHALRYKYVAVGEEDIVLSGVYEIMNQVEKKMDKKEFRHAFELAILCYSKTAQLYKIDDETFIHDELVEINHFLETIIQMGLTNWTLEAQEDILTKLLKTADLLKFAPHWQLKLLELALPFCQDPIFSDIVCTKVENLSFESENDQNQADDLILEALLISEDEEKIQAFLASHPKNPNIREKMIQMAFENKKYEKVLKLSSDGIDNHFGEIKIRAKWEKYAYEAHKQLGNQEDMQRIAFIRAAEGDFHFYHELKELYTSEEWKPIINELMDSFDDLSSYPAWYPALLIEEQAFEKLITFCRQSPKRIYSYSKYLRKEFPEEVKSLFFQSIANQLNIAKNRNDYKALRESLCQMQKEGYVAEVKDIIEQIKATYPRRTALQDELKGLV
ncbi:SWIM zinc finger family protein [Rummeliibacillus suwonensis]|uniref:SWIM zinc finger family protein n=1 Tax=Rummeliibacillus suwonensis TaxID=1306154 RepID=UPI001AAF3B53|nr:SWIM zinc finger family protein [Rummeliibacillus suwonensis]MBO2535340.1 SWIM zinc finger family protein [Rummeliibacillus suwonensis]